MSSTKFAYKEFPQFEPKYYRYWATIVKDAFAEHNRMDYLLLPPPDSSFTPDLTVSARVKAFLSQSVQYSHRAYIDGCDNAGMVIWTIFLQRYSQTSRDDELRLEAELLSLVKLSTQSLDEYIEKFDDIISSI